MRKYNVSQKVLAVVLTLGMILGMIPVSASAVAANAVIRKADPSTMNAYQQLFLDPDTVGVELTTENAGGVWTDKSVFSADNLPSELTDALSDENTKISIKDTGDNFLVALSAIASNKEIVGYSTRPTDTMLVLDLSGSMEGSVSTMVSAANKAIGDLLALNQHNRVGVVLYSGSSSFGNSGTGTATLLMPLNRYSTTSTTTQNGTRIPLYIQSNNNERVSVASGVTPKTGLGGAKDTTGGTYTQNGIYKAMQELVDASDKVIPEGSLQAGTARMPIMVLMSDGEPSSATKNYTNIGTSDVGEGRTGTSYAHDMAFLTQLTMAYAKREIETAYTVVVTVVDNGFGDVEATYTVNGGNDAIVFTNQYDITEHNSIVLGGTKVMTGDRTTVAAGEFTFGLYYPDGSIVKDSSGKEVTATNDADGKFVFRTMYFGKNQLGPHTYQVKEIVPTVNPTDGITYDTTVYEVEVHVVDNGNGGVDVSYTVDGSAHNTVVFTNTYEAADVKVQLEGSKTYDKPLKGDDFTFVLTGNGVNQTKKNDANGKIVFDELTFTEVGVYTYTVTETDKLLGFIDYSKAVYEVVITVTDDTKGQLVAAVNVDGKANGEIKFVNKYVLDGEDSIVLEGTKVLTGDRTEMAAGEFSFGLFDSNGKLLQEVKNDADGKFAFAALIYDENHVGKHTYTVQELAGSDVYMTYDDTVYTVEVTVIDNGVGGVEASYTVTDGPIRFANVYTAPDPVQVQFDVLKNVVNLGGQGISPEGFEFVLTCNGESVTDISDADGKAGFSVSFDLADVGSKFVFTVAETKGRQLGVIYDTAVHTFTVEVAQNADGTLKTLINGEETAEVAVAFTNTYDPSSIPGTGDSFDLILVVCVMVVSLGGIITLLLVKKRKGGKYAK